MDLIVAAQAGGQALHESCFAAAKVTNKFNNLAAFKLPTDPRGEF